jgi:MarR family transcriptional regulator, 2-MHQ and catechol-resistance regulon repressor
MKLRGVDARTSLALGTYVKLLRAAQTVHARVTRSLAGHDLSPSQFAVLEALHHVGPLCLSDLAHKVLMTGGNITMVVTNLEKRGLVKRIPGEQDRRFITAEITAAGRRLMERVFPGHAEAIAELMSALTVREQRDLGALCRNLGNAAAGRAD